MAMILKTTRELCTTADAARAFGVTMGRIRQMALAGELWSENMGEHCLVFDHAEVKKKAAERAAARAAGHIRGPKPGGFKKDRPISKKRLKPA
jgi:hypothetical protein